MLVRRELYELRTELKELVLGQAGQVGTLDALAVRKGMKENHPVAMGYVARASYPILFRRSIRIREPDAKQIQ